MPCIVISIFRHGSCHEPFYKKKNVIREYKPWQQKNVVRETRTMAADLKNIHFSINNTSFTLGS